MIFVLGAKGFVGSSVLSVLRSIDECVGIDRNNYEEHAGRKCDVLVNANGNSKKYLSAEQPVLDFDLSVRSVARSIQDFPTDCYVHISSVDVYTNFNDALLTAEDVRIDNSQQSPYGFHKWLAETYVRRWCANWLILRLGGMIGPGLRKGPMYDLMNDVPLRVHIDSRFQYIPTKSIGEVIAFLLHKSVRQEVFNVCGRGTVSLRDVSSWLGKTSNDVSFLEKQVYDINNQKLSSIYPVPTTEDSVRRFLSGYQRE